jgi:hypothetical protein
LRQGVIYYFLAQACLAYMLFEYDFDLYLPPSTVKWYNAHISRGLFLTCFAASLKLITWALNST